MLKKVSRHLLLVIAMFFIGISVYALESSSFYQPMNAASSNTPVSFTLKNGEYIYFGKMVQDASDPASVDASSMFGDSADPLRWRVLESNTSSDTVFLASDSGLIYSAWTPYTYSGSGSGADYKDTDFYRWINTVFAANGGAFSSQEDTLIIPQSFSGSGNSPYHDLRSGQSSRKTGTSNVEIAMNDASGQKAFALSGYELLNTTYFPTPASADINISAWASSGSGKVAYTYSPEDIYVPLPGYADSGATWSKAQLLRTPSTAINNMTKGGYVDGIVTVSTSGTRFTGLTKIHTNLVRPATKIKKSDIAFGVGSDDDYTVDATTALKDSASSENKKLVLKDDTGTMNIEHDETTVHYTSSTGGNIASIKYKNAVSRSGGDGTNYIDVFIMKKGTQDVLSFGRVLWDGSSSGTIEFKEPPLASGSYDLYLALEEVRVDSTKANWDLIAYHYASPLSAPISYVSKRMPTITGIADITKTVNDALSVKVNITSDTNFATPSYIYEWYKKGSGGAADTKLSSTTDTLSIASLSSLDAGSYYVVIRDPANPNIFKVKSNEFKLQINKANQSTLNFYKDAAFTTKITTLTKDKMDVPFDVFVSGGEASIADNGITYSITSDPNHILTSCIGSGNKATITLSKNVGTAQVTAIKPGNSDYNEVKTTLSITTTAGIYQPLITAIKTADSSVYTSTSQYNKDVKIKFSYPAGYSGSIPLKLKQRDRSNYTAPWNTIAATTIANDHEISVNLNPNEWKYIEYELYMDGYENQAVTFIVDLFNIAPSISDPVDGMVYTDKKQINLDLYPGRKPTSNPCTATLNGNPYTSLSDIGNGTHNVIISDTYGNTQTIDFTINLPGPSAVFKATTLIYDDPSTDRTIPNKVAGKVSVTSGTSPYTYAPKDSATSSKFRIDSSGNVYIIDGVSLSAGSYPVVFSITDGDHVTSDVSGTIIVDKGIQKDMRFVDAIANTLPNTAGVYDALEETYGVKKKFPLDVLGNEGTLTYQLKETSIIVGGTTINLSDVIDVNPTSGEITIKNASLLSQRGNVIVVATSNATSNYEEKSIEIPINIQKAAQSSFAFKYKDKTVQAGKGSFKPEFINDLSDSAVILTSSDAMVSVSGTHHDTFSYDVADKKDIILKAQKPGNRNYEDSPIAMMTLHVLAKGQTLFDVSIQAQDTSTNKVYYGDSSAQFIPVKPEAGTTFTYRSLDATIADMNGTDTFIPKKAGTVTFEITKQKAGESDVVITKDVIIYPKKITIDIEDKEMFYGEALPPFTYHVPAADLVGMDTITNITLSCMDGSIPVSSTSKKGTYVIKGSYTKSDYPNYDISFRDGTLTIKQETPLAPWYDLVGILGEQGWYRSDVDVVLSQKAIDNGYTLISGDQATWANKFTIVKEDENTFTAYFKKVSGAMSEGLDGTLKIDKKAPKIASIKAVNSNNSLADLLNKITFNAFFKPGTDILIQGDDGNGSAKVSGVKEASYTIQKLDISNQPVGTPIKASANADMNGLIKVRLDETGTYKVCAILKDYAGNAMEEASCVQVSVKDPQLDYDSDDDGCPDLNITLGTGKPILNIDHDLDGVPELNIDTDGDGKADINIDSDDDGKPDLNLIILKEWNPNTCTKDREFNYGYQSDIKARINIDTNNDMVPDINIDSDGDFKADINIAKAGETKPYLNIASDLKPWKPNKDYIYEGFSYDTASSIKRRVNIDTNGDLSPDVNVDLTGNGLPDINIDLDGDEIPDTNIDIDGDGIADLNIDADNDGTVDSKHVTIDAWIPDKKGEVNGIVFDTMSNLSADDVLDQLKHDPSGIIIEQVNAQNSFKKSQYLVVDDISTTINNEDMRKITSKINDANLEVKEIYHLKLIEDNVEIQPDQKIKVKIPLDEALKKLHSIKLLVEQKDGTYAYVTARNEDGYLVYTTDFLGKVSIIADKDDVNSGSNIPPSDDIETSVKGASIVKGGALTADQTNVEYMWLLLFISMIMIMLMKKKLTNNH